MVMCTDPMSATRELSMSEWIGSNMQREQLRARGHTVDGNLRARQHEVDRVGVVTQHALVEHAGHDLVDKGAAIRARVGGRAVSTLRSQGQ